MNHSWIGLRDEDLSDAERRLRAASDSATRSEDEAELGLGQRLARLPDVPVRRAPRSRRGAVWVTGSLAAVGLGLVLLPQLMPRGGGEVSPLRARGGGSAEVAVVLRAVAEGGETARVLHEDDALLPGERVVFEVETDEPGSITVDEQDQETRRVWPAESRWEVQAGRHFVGGERTLAWQADTPGVHVYVAEFCPSSGAACVRSTLRLSWPTP